MLPLGLKGIVAGTGARDAPISVMVSALLSSARVPGLPDDKLAALLPRPAPPQEYLSAETHHTRKISPRCFFKASLPSRAGRR